VTLTAPLTATDVFYAGEEKGLMCRIDLQGVAGPPFLLVAPITHFSFNRRHPIARDIAAYRELRTRLAV